MSTDAKKTGYVWRSVACLVFTLAVIPMSARGAEPGPISLLQPDGHILSLSVPATRIVSLSPNLTELVYAAGAGHLLVATVEYSNYPADAMDLPRVGNAFRIDTEQIHLLSPDLVLAWQSGNPAAAVTQLDGLGFNVWRIEIRQPKEIADIIEQIGMATGTEQIAAATSRELRNRIEDLKGRHGDLKPVSYFYQVAAQPLYTVNGEHLISRGLSLCGGENVFANLPTLAPQVGIEAVLMADPQLFIGPDIEGQPDPLEHWHSWPGIRAVSHGNFLLVPADPISRATPRFFDAIELACNMLDKLRKQ